MRYYASLFYTSPTIGDSKNPTPSRVVTCIPEPTAESGRGEGSEIDALIAGHRAIVKQYEEFRTNYGTGPYYAVYREGMVLPFGSAASKTPFSEEEAELYAGPFQTWTAYQQFLHENVPLTDTMWRWGRMPLAYVDRDEVEKIIAAIGKPKVEPIYA